MQGCCYRVSLMDLVLMFCCGCDVSLFVAGDFDSLGFLRGLCCVVWCWSYMAGLMLS